MTLDAAHPSAWLASPAGLVLGPDELHVWRVPLHPPREQIAVLARRLSDDERERAARFHFERDRMAYTAARGALRTLIGRYLAQPPDRLVFGYRAKGKPYLATPGDALSFNLSHSGEVGLLGFARDREIGIDVEHRRSMDDLRSLARVSFSAQEYATLCSLPPDDQTDAFFSCWARKEAFIKATGEGVSQLADFDVSLRPGEPARLLRVDGEAPGRPRWSMHELPSIAGYAAAVVVEGAAIRIACWEWPPAGAG
jgi:4'-phosphopantetheinyl transferase